ncbi:MAG: sulfur carrier protein ThiS [Salinisphaeraceae bacterium]
MQIQLNGEPRTVEDDADLDRLITDLGLDGRRLAVEVNGDIVTRTARAGHALQDGDRIEIVHAIGGG